MADQKLTQLPATTTPALTDLLYIVTDPGGTPASQSVTVTLLLALAGAATVALGNITGAVTINFTSGRTQKATLTGNVTFTFSNGVNGAEHILILTQDGTGGRTIAWPAAAKLQGNTFTPTDTAGQTDVLKFVFDGTNYWEVARAVNE